MIVNKACLPSFLPSFLLPVPLHHRQKNSIINSTEKRPGSHLVHAFIVMHTVKDISQSRMPFPSLQTAPGTTVIGQETQFMHLLRSNEASPPRTFKRLTCFSPAACLPNQSLQRLLLSPHLRPTRTSRRRQLQSCTFVLPALLLDDNFRAARSSYLRFSSTTTSKLCWSTWAGVN